MNENGFCPNCGKIKEEPSLSYCLNCYEMELSDYKKVKEYVRNHPNSNAIDVAKGTGVDISKIMKYIKDKTLLLK